MNPSFLKFLIAVFRTNNNPPIPNLREEIEWKFFFGGLVRGLLVIGKPGVGKTRLMAYLVVAYILAFPDQGAIVLDASGNLVNDILAITMGLPPDQREMVTKRLIVDILGHKEFTQTQPEFHPAYGVSYEKQIQRVAENLRRLNPVSQEYGVMGIPAFEELAPELFRLLCAIENEYGETWQLTESKILMLNLSQRAIAVAKFGHKVPEAKFFFEQYNNKGIDIREQEKRSFTLRSALGVIEPRDIRARIGYYKPTWTPKELVSKGLIALVTGENMLDQELQMNYIFTQIYSLFRQEMNQRRPNDPVDKPFLFCIDEAPVLLKVPGLAREIGEISTFYRSRKLWLVIIIQALWQLADELRDQVWSMGNICAFSVEDIKDCRELATQLFHYAPRMVKQEPRTENQNPTTEPDHGQYTLYSNWLQSFKQREFIVRRYFDEARLDPFVRHFQKTPDVPIDQTREELEEFKERIFKERAIPIREALEIINKRALTAGNNKNQPPNVN